MHEWERLRGLGWEEKDGTEEEGIFVARTQTCTLRGPRRPKNWSELLRAAPVDRNCPLRLFAESGDNKELSVVGPHDPGALLGDDLCALYYWLGTGSGVEDADATVLAHRRQEPAALAELGGVQLEKDRQI